jgi:hypothetical protein
MAKPASALLALTRMWVHNLQAIQAVLVAEGIVPIVDGAAWACRDRDDIPGGCA